MASPKEVGEALLGMVVGLIGITLIGWTLVGVVLVAKAVLGLTLQASGA